MMAAREHGNVLTFTFTALAGTLAMVALGTLLSGVTWLRAIGRNALALLGLNGAFFHYVDPRLSHVLHVPASRVAVAVDASVVTLLSLLLCAPVAYLLNRHVPQLVGFRPASNR
jgi:acyltransferase